MRARLWRLVFWSWKFWLAVFVGCLLLTAGAVFVLRYTPLGPALLGAKQVTLTGKDRAGQIEVPVLNLWARPGFGPDNQVVARLQFPSSGEESAQLVAREEVAGLSWYKVRLANGATGWVMARFVKE